MFPLKFERIHLDAFLGCNSSPDIPNSKCRSIKTFTIWVLKVGVVNGLQGGRENASDICGKLG